MENNNDNIKTVEMTVIRSSELSKPHETRYVCVDKKSGDILDDAQGYGYKSPSKAYAAYAYKNRSDESLAREQSRIETIAEYIRGHRNEYRSLIHKVEDIEFCGLKDGCCAKEIDDEIRSVFAESSFPVDVSNIHIRTLFRYIDEARQLLRSREEPKPKKIRRKKKKVRFYPPKESSIVE